MDRACAKPGERLVVRVRRVALVIGEAIAGMTNVEQAHHLIALDFRKDGSGGDAGGFGVAFDDRLLGMAISFNRFASISKCCGVDRNPWTARCIARRPAQ
jgi:hypothetical protein